MTRSKVTPAANLPTFELEAGSVQLLLEQATEYGASVVFTLQTLLPSAGFDRAWRQGKLPARSAA